MAHVMLDIETIGTDADTIVLTVGAVIFNKDGFHGEREWTLDLEEQRKLGRTFDHQTLYWWLNQKPEARKAFDPVISKTPLIQFLDEFNSFLDESIAKLGEKRDELKPWGNAAMFDITIVEDLFRRHHPHGKNAIPWKFWNVFCFRTFNHLTKAKDLVKREGIYHNAVDDAKFQARCVQAFWKKQASKK